MLVVARKKKIVVAVDGNRKKKIVVTVDRSRKKKTVVAVHGNRKRSSSNHRSIMLMRHHASKAAAFHFKYCNIGDFVGVRNSNFLTLLGVSSETSA